MGYSIIKNNFLGVRTLLLFIFLYNTILAQIVANKNSPKTKNILKYYNYWNPYRRQLDGEHNRDFFISTPFYETQKNKNGKLKTVTKYDSDDKKVDSWHLVWDRKGTRSEYSIKFHQNGTITRLDSLLFSHKLSEVKPGWKAKVKSKKDGRPLRFDIYDEFGIRYYFYRFHYKQRSDSMLTMETIQSSYFRSDSSLVGRHLLFMENGEWLREIHYKNSKDELEQIVKFDVSLKKEETIKTTLDSDGRKIESRIIQLSYPDQYSYRFEWKPDTIMIVEDIKIEKDTTITYISPVLASTWYGLPLIQESSLSSNPIYPSYGFFFAPRGNMIIKGNEYSLGMEVVSYKIPIKDSTGFFIGGVGAFAAAQYNLNYNSDWIPQNVEAALRLGGGMLASGYGVSLSGSFGYHLLPSRYYIGVYVQSIIAIDEINEGAMTGWGSLGLSFGANVGDINPDLLKPYQDKLDEEALVFNLVKQLVSKSNIIFSIDNPVMVDTIITESYFPPNVFNGYTVRTPFSLSLGSIEFNFVLEYLDYIYEPKKVNDPNYEGNAYFFGTNIVLDKLFKLGGDRLGKSILLEVGSYHSGFGICTGLELDYHFNRIPFFIHAYGKLYGLPNEEIFTGWFSMGLGVGIDLETLFLNSKSEQNAKKK